MVGEIVIYPFTDYYTGRYPSHRGKAKGYALSTTMLQWFWDTYLAGKTADKAPLRTTPLRAPNLALLPATLLVTAEHDPLRDEGIAYRDKLQSEGVSVQYRHFDNAEHGFACSLGVRLCENSTCNPWAAISRPVTSRRASDEPITRMLVHPIKV